MYKIAGSTIASSRADRLQWSLGPGLSGACYFWDLGVVAHLCIEEVRFRCVRAQRPLHNPNRLYPAIVFLRRGMPYSGDLIARSL